jgi:hypothetical protein
MERSKREPLAMRGKSSGHYSLTTETPKPSVVIEQASPSYSFRSTELSQPDLRVFPSLGSTRRRVTQMPSTAILREAHKLRQVSDSLDILASQHPFISEALIQISGSIRSTATLLQVLVVTKIGTLPS